MTGSIFELLYYSKCPVQVSCVEWKERLVEYLKERDRNGRLKYTMTERKERNKWGQTSALALPTLESPKEQTPD